MVRLLFAHRSTKIGPPVIDWAAAIFGDKGNHTMHVWNWMAKHRDVPILILGHKPLKRELRRRAKASGIHILYPMRYSDLIQAIMHLVKVWPSILSLHSQVERDLGIRSTYLFHARSACWFLRGFLHKSWVEASPTKISKGVIFGLIAHVDTRIAEHAFRTRRIRTIHWLHGIVEDALHFRAKASICLCVTPNDVRIRHHYGNYGQCLGPHHTNRNEVTIRTGGRGLLLVTNLLHPDNRFAAYGVESHLRSLLEITAACCKKGDLIIWRPHPRESDSSNFTELSRFATRLGIQVDNHTPFRDQMASCHRVISTPSTTIGDLAAAGIVPAIFDGLPFESSGHINKLPSELTFKSAEELEITFRILDDDEKRLEYLDALLIEYPVSRPTPDAISEAEIPANQAKSGALLISIVTPSYKQLDFLKCCAASVQDQEGDFWMEHLIQDGGTGREFTQWATKQKEAVCVSEPDDGMYDAINRGFRKSKGDIIAWLNCDEQYLPGTLERVANYFKAHPETDILIGDVILVDETMAPLAYRRATKPTVGHIRYSHLSTFSAATFVRRRVLDDGHYLKIRWKTIADAVWIEELLSAGYICDTIPEPLAIFCMLGSNLGQSALLFAERLQWESELKSTNTFWKAYHVAEYRINRLLAGAYTARRLTVSAYLREGESRREKTSRISGFWSAGKSKAAQLKSDRDSAITGLTIRTRPTQFALFHAAYAIFISIYVDNLFVGDAAKGPPILIFSLMYLSFRSRVLDLAVISFLYFLTSIYALRDKPIDLQMVRLITFAIGSVLAIFWTSGLRNLEEWIRSTVALIRKNPTPMILSDSKGKIILINRAACLFGNLEETSLLNRTIYAYNIDDSGKMNRLPIESWQERPPDKSVRLSVDPEINTHCGDAEVFVVGRGRYQFYAFTLVHPSNQFA